MRLRNQSRSVNKQISIPLWEKNRQEIDKLVTVGQLVKVDKIVTLDKLVTVDKNATVDKLVTVPETNIVAIERNHRFLPASSDILEKKKRKTKTTTLLALMASKPV